MKPGPARRLCKTHWPNGDAWCWHLQLEGFGRQGRSLTWLATGGENPSNTCISLFIGLNILKALGRRIDMVSVTPALSWINYFANKRQTKYDYHKFHLHYYSQFWLSNGTGYIKINVDELMDQLNSRPVYVGCFVRGSLTTPKLTLVIQIHTIMRVFFFFFQVDEYILI